MPYNLIFQQNYTKKPPKKGATFFMFGGVFRARFQDGSRMAPGPPKSSKNQKKMHRFPIIVSCIYALWTAYSFSKFLHRIQYFWHSPPQAVSANSIRRLLGGAAMARRRCLQYFLPLKRLKLL